MKTKKKKMMKRREQCVCVRAYVPLPSAAAAADSLVPAAVVVGLQVHRVAAALAVAASLSL